MHAGCCIITCHATGRGWYYKEKYGGSGRGGRGSGGSNGGGGARGSGGGYEREDGGAYGNGAGTSYDAGEEDYSAPRHQVRARACCGRC